MSVPTARPASRSFLAACVLSVSCGLSLQAWAVDTDQDGLSDDWEIAHGRDPARPDYLIASNSYPYGGNSTRTDSCSIINGAVNCTWGVGGGIPGTLPFSSGVSPADAYGVDLSNANVVLYRGYSGNSYKNSWSIYIYPPSVANVANPFTVRTLPTSFSSTKNFSIQCFDSHFGLVSRDVTSTLACSVSSSKQMTCTQSTPYCTAPTTRYVTINYSTKGTIAHVAGTPTVACAMTEYGPECFGSGNPFTGTYDPDSDGVSGVND
ncbi:MAG TPA: thrombospondin type 3 repeat-containing protein, partial [Pseudomonadales bacterium]|nr:thrombospondin type 3 repeat-containing protein [Pseudomonadales bacterium]